MSVLRRILTTLRGADEASADVDDEHRWFTQGMASGGIHLGGRRLEVLTAPDWTIRGTRGSVTMALVRPGVFVALIRGVLDERQQMQRVFEVYREVRVAAEGGALATLVDLRALEGTTFAVVRTGLDLVRAHRDPRDETVAIFSEGSRWVGAMFRAGWLGSGRFAYAQRSLRESLGILLGRGDAAEMSTRDDRLESLMQLLLTVTREPDATAVDVPPAADALTRDFYLALRAVQTELAALHAARRAAQEDLARKVLERTAALEQAKERAELAVMTQQSFLSTMNHEVRTPLNGIVGAARLMERWELSDDRRELLDTLLFSAQHLQSLVDDVLDYAKIEAGALEMDMLPLDLRRLLHGVAQAERLRAMQKGTALRLEIDPALPAALRGDSVRINQILFNLMGNAVKFTEKGEVAIHARFVGVEGASLRVELQVSDTGPGIAAELLPTLFDAFSPATRGTARRYGGTGLGLAISQRIARLHGGAITVRSTVGHGSEFTVSLLLERDHDHTTRRSAPRRDLSGLRVLVIEDNPMNQIVVTRFLRLWRVDTTCVDDGAEGLRAMRARSYDVVLLDLHMPELDGFEVLRQLRVDGDTTPVIAVSADASTPTQERVIAAGADGFVSKPFQPDDLYARLAEISARRTGPIAPPSLDPGA
jgi:signal transduction histidine kinase/ActR/RegA family two-component response regulator